MKLIIDYFVEWIFTYKRVVLPKNSKLVSNLGSYLDEVAKVADAKTD